MIDPKRYMILIDGDFATFRVQYLRFNPQYKSFDIQFVGQQRVYHYPRHRVTWLKDPQRLDPRHVRLSFRGKIICSIVEIYCFSGSEGRYLHLCFENGSSKDYRMDALTVEESVLSDDEAQQRLDYFKEIASVNSLLANDGHSLLLKQYDRLQFIDSRLSLASYLQPQRYPIAQYKAPDLIFPFGCNASQKQAVRSAFESQISVIQGPPGTGKTQTILNIIANILVQRKTVLVVSNNNSAIENVLEKLEKNQLGFLAAMLGSSKNKQLFVDSQQSKKQYPTDLLQWKLTENSPEQINRQIQQNLQRLDALFDRQIRLALARQELDALHLEWTHFQKYVPHNMPHFELRNRSKSQFWMQLWNELQQSVDRQIDRKNRWSEFLLKLRIRFGMLAHLKQGGQSFVKQSPERQIDLCKIMFYQLRLDELKHEIEELSSNLADENMDSMLSDLTAQSMLYLKDRIARRFGELSLRAVFSFPMSHKESDHFLSQYPVVLSTTFSSRSNFDEQTVFDYVIMDEASQVSSETGALALSCAKRAVVVGDSLQLPNVVTRADLVTYNQIASKYPIPEAYHCGRYSFLESVIHVFDSLPQTLLREHYRCHPQIINFCNQKFYHGQLVIMTKDRGEEDVLSAVRTVRGNHARDHMNQREIDVIEQEVLPRISSEEHDVGIISPYNHQVEALQAQFLDRSFDVATVHKFQGREKDAMIMTTVDDHITPFSDDPNLLNVAISRAKRQFCLVVSGEDQPPKSNISDLLGYIEYHNFAVRQSRIRSIFDNLYKQYTVARFAFLRTQKRISEYDSENLTYALIQETLRLTPEFGHLDVICHQSLNLLLRDLSLLTFEELRYVSHDATHLDFVVYNQVSKQLVLAIETDGYMFHKQGTRQHERDLLKNSILEKYQIPFLRLSTTGSGEKQKIVDALHRAMGCDVP